MINVIIASDPRYSINRASIQSAVLNILKKHNVSTGKVELEVNIVGDRKIHELNKKYRGIDAPTDILSFVLEDPNPQHLLQMPAVGFVASPDKILRLGSIVIAYPQAVEDASSDGISVEDEISFLVEHGTTHLLGIHHDPH